jgi:hypothetical protein
LGPGMILEFGVASGLTLTAIANASGRNVIGFDSFKGLPRDWRTGVQEGASPVRRRNYLETPPSESE